MIKNIDTEIINITIIIMNIEIIMVVSNIAITMIMEHNLSKLWWNILSWNLLAAAGIYAQL